MPCCYIYTKRLAAIEEVRKESVPRNHKNSVKTGLRQKRNYQKDCAEVTQEQRENRVAAQREITKKIVPRNRKSNLKTGLRLKEIMPKQGCLGIT